MDCLASGSAGSPASIDASNAESGTSPASRPSSETGDGEGLSELRVGDLAITTDPRAGTGPRTNGVGDGVLIEVVDTWSLVPYVLLGRRFLGDPEVLSISTDWLKLFWRPE